MVYKLNDFKICSEIRAGEFGCVHKARGDRDVAPRLAPQVRNLRVGQGELVDLRLAFNVCACAFEHPTLNKLNCHVPICMHMLEQILAMFFMHVYAIYPVYWKSARGQDTRISGVLARGSAD